MGVEVFSGALVTDYFPPESISFQYFSREKPVQRTPLLMGLVLCRLFLKNHGLSDLGVH